MIDFLKDSGIEDKVIAILNNKYYDNILYSINCNEYEIKRIIDYLRSIGINCIDELLIDHINLFLQPLENIENIFNKTDINSLVSSINNNPDIIDNII